MPGLRSQARLCRWANMKINNIYTRVQQYNTRIARQRRPEVFCMFFYHRTTTTPTPHQQHQQTTAAAATTRRNTPAAVCTWMTDVVWVYLSINRSIVVLPRAWYFINVNVSYLSVYTLYVQVLPVPGILSHYLCTSLLFTWHTVRTIIQYNQSRSSCFLLLLFVVCCCRMHRRHCCTAVHEMHISILLVPMTSCDTIRYDDASARTDRWPWCWWKRTTML